MNPGLLAGLLGAVGIVIIMAILVLEAYGVFDQWYREHPPR